MVHASPLCSPLSSAFHSRKHITTLNSFSPFCCNLKVPNFPTSHQHSPLATHLSLQIPTPQVTQALNSLQDPKLENPDVMSSPLSKTHIWVNPKSPRAKQLLKNSYYDASSRVKLAKSLDSCDPNEQHVSEILKGSGDNVTERDAVLILYNVVFVFKYLQHKFEKFRHVILYNVTMKLFRGTREFERAEKLCDEMLQRGVEPNLITFSTMIICAALCSMPHKAVVKVNN